jgi:hypothetical protein
MRSVPAGTLSRRWLRITVLALITVSLGLSVSGGAAAGPPPGPRYPTRGSPRPTERTARNRNRTFAGFDHAAVRGRPQRCWRSLRTRARSRRCAARTSGWRSKDPPRPSPCRRAEVPCAASVRPSVPILIPVRVPTPSRSSFRRAGGFAPSCRWTTRRRVATARSGWGGRYVGAGVRFGAVVIALVRQRRIGERR